MRLAIDSPRFVLLPFAPLGSEEVRVEGLQAAAEAVADNFRRVHFALGASALDAQARDALDRNAELLARLPALKVAVQGHADQRGPVDCDLALGHARHARRGHDDR